MTAETQGSDLPGRALLPFLLITFGIAWGLFVVFALFPQRIVRTFGPLSARNPLFILAVYAPAIAAISLVLIHGGFAALNRFLARLTWWRAPASWWAFLLFGIPLVYILGSALKGSLAAYQLPFDSLAAALGGIGFMLILGPVEELGWRGVALPLLQRRLAPIWASILLGSVWGIWHLPAFLMSGTPQSAWGFGPFLVGAIAISVILTSVFNASGGSLLLAMLFHFQLNNPLWPDAQPHDSAVFLGVAGIVAWSHRKVMFSRAGGITLAVPPRASQVT